MTSQPPNFTSVAPADVVPRMLHAQTAQETWAHFSEAVADLGFTRLLYACTRSIPADQKMPDAENALVLFRGEEDFVDAYLGTGLYRSSPINQWAAENTGFKSWASILSAYDGPFLPEHAQIMQLYARHEMLSGYCGSIKDTVRDLHGIIGMASEPGATDAQTDAL